jgi:hypothetical protein
MPFKVCRCGRSYSLSEWKALPRLGIADYRVESADPLLELRHCVCRSTLAVHWPYDSKPTTGDDQR